MEGVDTVKFIREVEKRPEIWNTYSKEYLDRNRRKEAWLDISAIVIHDFPNKCELEIEAIVKDLQYKWKNLRDCYTRNQRLILEQKMTQSGKPIKQYTFARHLRFLETLALSKEYVKSRLEPLADYPEIKETKKRRLTNEVLKQETKSNSGSVNESLVIPYIMNENDLDNTREEVDLKIEQEDDEVLNNQTKSADDNSLLMNYIAQQQSQYYQQMQQTQQMLAQSFKDDNDDIQFFKSLLPTLQTFSLDQKLTFRIEVMKLLAKYLEDSRK